MKKLLRLLGWKPHPNIEERRIKAYVRDFLENRETEVSHYEITDVTIVKGWSKIVIKVTLGKPGLFIGPYAKQISDLENQLTQRFEKPTKIKVFEKNVWR